MKEKSEAEVKVKQRSKTRTISGIEFEIPILEIVCEKCNAANYFYDDDPEPFYCDECGMKLKNYSLQTAKSYYP